VASHPHNSSWLDVIRLRVYSALFVPNLRFNISALKLSSLSNGRLQTSHGFVSAFGRHVRPCKDHDKAPSCWQMEEWYARLGSDRGAGGGGMRAEL
jgi:hypothetical protein